MDVNGSMARMDDRFIGEKARYSLLSVISTPSRKRLGINEGGVAGSGFSNGVALVDNVERRYVRWWAGEMSAVGEPVFVPRSADAAEMDGFVICMVSRFLEHHAELVILDLADFHKSTEEGDDIQPVARIVLPFRLRSGVHGSWVPASDLGEWKQLCDMHGVDEKTMTRFGDEIYHGTANGEVLHGHDKWDRDNHGGVDGHAPGAEVVGPHSRDWKLAKERLRYGPNGWGTAGSVDGVVNGVNGIKVNGA